MIGVVFSVAVVIVYGAVLRRRARAHRRFHDRASRRELTEAVALFLASLSAASAVAAVIVFGDQGTGAAGLAGLGAWGAFLAAGVVILTEPPRR